MAAASSSIRARSSLAFTPRPTPITRGAELRSTWSKSCILVSITFRPRGVTGTSSMGAAAPLAAGAEPPSSTSTTGPETAMVSSAISPKTGVDHGGHVAVDGHRPRPGQHRALQPGRDGTEQHPLAGIACRPA